MPELNFNALQTEGPRSLLQGLEQGRQLQNQLAQQAQQKQLADIQLQNALSEQKISQEEQAAWKAGAGDSSKVLNELKTRGLGKQAMALQSQITKDQADKLNQHKTQLELIKKAATQIFASPEGAIPILQNFAKQTGIDMSDDIAQVQQLGTNPTAIKQWAAGHAFEADKLLPVFKDINLHGETLTGTVNPVTGKFEAGKTLKHTQTPSEIAANARALASQSLLERKFAYEKANPGYTVQEAGDGSLIAVNKNNPRDVQPISVGGVPVKGKVSPAPESFVKADIQLANLSDTLKSFKDEVNKKKTTTGAWAPKGEDTAALTSKYQALLMRVKDLYQLGALTGPDLGIVEAQISNPASWSGMFVSGKGVDAQIKTLERMITDGSKTLEDAYGRKPNATTKALSRAGAQDSDWSVVK